MSVVWSIFSEELNSTRKKHDLQIHSFVLMSNHFYLIASTPQANISQCMFQFMGQTSRKLARAGNRINETFAGRHFKCVLQRMDYFLNAYKYNYRNPVSAGICNSVQDYPYSTLPAVMKTAPESIKLLEDTTYVSDPTGTLNWLNEKPEQEKIEAVRFGLRHQCFKSKKDPILNKPIMRDHELL